MANMRLLLGSGGFSTDERRAGWSKELDDYLGDIKNILFIPYAHADHDAYVEMIVKKKFHAGRTIVGIHTHDNPKQAIMEAETIFMGGGNSFRLLAELYQHDLLAIIRERVQSGMPYVGVSAGTVVACPAMKTTNDMPIIYPPSFAALGLVSFQINPHYFSGATHIKIADDFIKYGGETRDDRIREFHEMNEVPVLGLWEGSILRVENELFKLRGVAGARLFRRGAEAKDFDVPCDLTAELAQS